MKQQKKSLKYKEQFQKKQTQINQKQIDKDGLFELLKKMKIIRLKNFKLKCKTKTIILLII